MAYPPGLRTDLEIHRLQGALIEDRTDHLIIRSPLNPTYHWGNCVWVTDPRVVNDPRRWRRVFAEAFPGVNWCAIGLAQPPAIPVWRAAGFEVDVSESLVAHAPPEGPPLPPGYTTRPLRDDADWVATVAFRAAQDAESGREITASDREFFAADGRARRRLVEAGAGAWFAAHDATGAHVAELGVVDCSGVARFQAIMTTPAHRGRGLAGHLIGVAGRWAAERGCTSWVIVVHAGNPARRLYRSLGFEPGAATGDAYRTDADVGADSATDLDSGAEGPADPTNASL